MKICLVTAFPPSGRQLNEYGLHLARELQKNPLLSLTIVGDELTACEWATDAQGKRLEAHEELPDFDVVRCWQFNSIRNPYRVLKVIRDIKPDVVWYNLVFSSFATQQHPVAAFAGLCIPALTRAAGYYTHVTLHHLMEHVDFGAANIRAERLFRFASSVATRMLLLSNSISVLLPAYRRTLMEKYRAENVHFRSHGILGARPEPPDFSRRGNPDHRILAIGHWGTYKRLETLMEAFRKVQRRVPSAKLVVAGANHHTTPGYWESIAEKHRDNARIEFRGYIAEKEIPELYSTASVVVLPYDSSHRLQRPGAPGLPVWAADHLVQSAGIHRHGERRIHGRGFLSARRCRRTGRQAGGAAAIAGTSARHGGAELLRRAAHDHAADHPRIPPLLRPAEAHAQAGAVALAGPLEQRARRELPLRRMVAVDVGTI